MRRAWLRNGRRVRQQFLQAPSVVRLAFQEVCNDGCLAEPGLRRFSLMA